MLLLPLPTVCSVLMDGDKQECQQATTTVMHLLLFSCPMFCFDFTYHIYNRY